MNWRDEIRIDRERDERRELINASCQARGENGLCLEAPECCRNCAGCQENFCDNHRTMIDGRVFCVHCTRIYMEIDAAADRLLEAEAA